jgi:hypothetical protein
VCFILELLTFSFTGYLGLLISLLFIVGRYFTKNRLWNSVVLALGIALFLGLLLSDKIVQLIADKSGSLAIHFEEILLKIDNPDVFDGIIFGNTSYSFSENYYKIILGNYGVLYFLGVVCFEIYITYLSYKLQKHNYKNICNFIAFVFIIVINICQFALPYLIIFPISYFYWLAVFWVLKESRKATRASKNKLLKNNLKCSVC